MKRYLTEALLITNTENIYDIIDWLYWHINIIGFEHIVLIDNDSPVNLNILCKFFGNKIKYIKLPGKLNQNEVYNKYVNNSDAYWVLPIDDDEFLYISDKYQNNIKNLIIANDNFKFLKFSFTWMMMFSKKLINTRNLQNTNIFELFDCYYDNEAGFFEDITNIKTMVNTCAKHYYASDNKNLKKTHFVPVNDLNIDNYEIRVNYNISNCYDHMATVHNPITILYKTFQHAYNITNNFIDIGYKSHSLVHHLNDAYLLHFKYKTKSEWDYKVNKRNKFDDVCETYYNNIYTNNAIVNAYNYNQYFKPNYLPKQLYNKYINNILKIKNNVLL